MSNSQGETSCGSNTEKSRNGSSSSSSSRSSTDTTTTSSEPSPSSSSQRPKMVVENKLLSSSREMRNMAEKMRRDKLNNYVTEIAGIVPLGSGASANKRIDKTSVLRLAANYIRMHKILNDEEDQSSNTTPDFGREIIHTLAEAVGGFLLVVTSSGKVVYITETVDQFFGHTQVDLLGHSIYNVIHPDDHELFQQQLLPRENCRRSFYCRMMEKALSRNDPGRYEIILVVGQLRPLPQMQASCSMASPASSFHSEANASSDHDEDESSDNEGEMRPLKVANRTGTHMLVGFVRVVKDRPITELTLVESTQDEYITRHGMDGKILYTDHRISFVTGLMPSEVVGTSAFNYMHQEDILWSIVAQKLMFTSTQGQGVVSYRLKCRDGAHITLRSRGFLEVNKQTGQVESFVCINTVLSVSEAMSEIKNQRRKLLPIVSCTDTEDHLSSISSSLPPELMMVLKQVINPETMRKMIESVKDCNTIIPVENFEPSEEMSFDSTPISTSPENVRDHVTNPFHSKPKRVRSEASSYTSRDSISHGGEDAEWHRVTKKRSNVDEFNMVANKKFSFQSDSSCPDLLHPNYNTNSNQNFSPGTSPQPCLSPTTSTAPDHITHPSGTCHQFSSDINHFDSRSHSHSVESNIMSPSTPQEYLKIDAIPSRELWLPDNPTSLAGQRCGQGSYISGDDCKITKNIASSDKDSQKRPPDIRNFSQFRKSKDGTFTPGLQELRISDSELPINNQPQKNEALSTPGFFSHSGPGGISTECNVFQPRCDAVSLPSGQNHGIGTYSQSTNHGMPYPSSYNQNMSQVLSPLSSYGHGGEQLNPASHNYDQSSCKVIPITSPSHSSYQFSSSQMKDHPMQLSPKPCSQYQPPAQGKGYSAIQSQYPYTIPAQDQGYSVPPQTFSNTSSGFTTEFPQQQQSLQGRILPLNQEPNLHAVPITTSYSVPFGGSGTPGNLL